MNLVGMANKMSFRGFDFSKNNRMKTQRQSEIRLFFKKFDSNEFVYSILINHRTTNTFYTQNNQTSQSTYFVKIK